MKAHNATTAVTTIVGAGPKPFVTITNVSDTVVYLKFDGTSTTLTAANGHPVLPNEMLVLDGPLAQFAVQVIHNATGNKELRVQGAD